MSTRCENGRGEGRLVLGLVVVGLGVLFLLENLGLIYVRNVWQFWPVILIVLGAARLANSYNTYARVSGGILVGMGGIFLASNLGYIPWNLWRLFWPLVLILWGVGMLFRGMERRSVAGGLEPARRWDRSCWGPEGTTGGASDSANTVHQWAVFGGSRRRVISQDFQGGEALAIFGGIRMDLREAASTQDEIHVDANALFGGVDIRVPENWSVTMRGAGIFGGFEDGTRSADNAIQPKKPNLVVTGMAVFGGVTVKN